MPKYMIDLQPTERFSYKLQLNIEKLQLNMGKD